MRALGICLLLLLAAACGDNVPPTVADIRASNPTLRGGQELFITLVSVEDPDGNVYAGKVKVKAEGPDLELEEEVVPFEDEPPKSLGDVIFGVQLSGAIPLGTWNFEVIFEDEAGAPADPRFTSVTLTN